MDDIVRYQLQNGELSRRRFTTALGLGVAGLVTLAPSLATAAPVKESEVDIKTPDGVADAFFVHPVSGTHPGVLIWPDIFGLRASFRKMARRLAESGYAVLVVNPFYRLKRAPTAPEKANFQDPAVREALSAQKASLTPAKNLTDARAFVAWLDGQAPVDKKRKMATTGYCMGGPIVMRTAAELPDRVGAAASFHGGGLATDAPESPHLLIPKMKAQFLIAIAENDDQKEPNAKKVLAESFAKAKLKAEIEVYQGALHGWCPPDSAAYNEALAEKAWSRMMELFKASLG